jgi:myb proto-oncogene protein
MQVQNGYKIKDTSIGTKPVEDTKPPAPKEEMDPPVSPNTLAYDEAMREAAETVAIRIADAEHKSFLAAAAVKEADRYAKFDEENDAMLKFAEELLEKCTADKQPYLLLNFSKHNYASKITIVLLVL